MKSGHKALGILLVVCSLFLNPILLSWMFSNDRDITSNGVFYGILFLEILIVLFGVSVFKINNSSLLNIGVALLSVIISVAFTVGFDRFYGAFLMPDTATLLFPPFSRANHNTAEFDLEVRINNLGFRGPNVSIVKKKKRVVIIGDSFTFGWGVEPEKTWIHLLSEAYPEFEFLNLGQGGNHPGDYVQVAKRAIPLLDPDFVLAGVLQGNDLHQLMRVIEYEETIHKPAVTMPSLESKTEKYQRYIRIIYPNLSTRFPAAVSIQKRWKSDSENLLSELTEEQVKRYGSINPEIRNWFEDGLMNPSLIYESLHHPLMFKEAADRTNPLYRKGVIRLQDHLAEIAAICENSRANFQIIDLPNRPYGFPQTLQPLVELGYQINGCDSLDASIATATAADFLGIGLIQPEMKQQNEPLFYNYDGHWNVEGNRIFAQELIKSLEKDSAWKHFQTSLNF